MKKVLGITLLSVGLLVVLNLFYYQKMYLWQVENHRHMLEEELNLLEKEVNHFYHKHSEIIPVISESDIYQLFNDSTQAISTRERLNIRFERNAGLLKMMSIEDKSGRCYRLLYDSLNHIHTDFIEHCNNKRDTTGCISIDKEQNIVYYHYPIIYGEERIGFIHYQIRLKEYFADLFSRISNYSNQFQMVVDTTGSNIYRSDNGIDETSYSDKKIIGSLTDSGNVIHKIRRDGVEEEVVSVYRRLTSIETPYLIVCSIPTSEIRATIIENTLWVGGISSLVILMIVIGFLVMMVRKAQALKRTNLSQEAIKKMIYYLPYGVLLLDEKKKIIQANKSLMKMLDIENEDVILGHLFQSDLLFENVEILETSFDIDNSSQFYVQRKDGSKGFITIEKIPFYLDKDKYWIYSFNRLSENEYKPVDTDAQNIFVANISHELRTPLNGIIGMIDLLSQSIEDKAETEMITILKRSADMLLSLINDILDFSKIKSGKFEVEEIPFNLYNEVKETIQSFMPRAKELGLQLTWDSNDLLPENFMGDPVRVRQILNNLLSNALKFTPHGKIYVSVTQTRLINGNAALQISVKDTGIGIKKETQKNIFKSFQQGDETTTRKYGGTGLGTTISKELVQLMGGEIWLKSPSDLSRDPENPGSEFCFTLPMRIKEQLKYVENEHITDFSQVECAVISDDIIHVTAITKNLNALHINCRLITPTHETIDKLRAGNNYQILIIDNRPDFNGIDFLQELFNANLHVNFFIIFQNSDNQNTHFNIARKLGADACLRKPVKLIVLRDFIVNHFPNIEMKTPIDAKEWQETLKILVVEDNQLNQRVAQNIFKKIGFSIDLASNGKEAVEKAINNHYDIIFMDIYMPEMDGIEATEAIRKMQYQGSVIAMTASNDKGERSRALDAGMDDYISKPVKTEDIQQMLTKWCSQRGSDEI